MNLVGELVLARNQILQQANTREDAALLGTSQRLNLITTELQEGVMKTRMQPIGNVWNKFPRVVRDLALACGKQVRVDLEGSETELDRTIIEAIKDPLTHLVRNAVDHGIEPPAERLRRGKPAAGCLRLRAFHESGQVNIEISDDGAGIDVERITTQRPGAGADHPRTGRAHGRPRPDAVDLPARLQHGRADHQHLGPRRRHGRGQDQHREDRRHDRRAEHAWRRGRPLKIKIPLTLAIIPALIVTAGGDCFAIPQVNLLELVRLEREQARQRIEMIHGAPVYRLRGSLLPLVNLDRMLNSLHPPMPPGGLADELAGEQTVNFAALREMHLRWKTRLTRIVGRSRGGRARSSSLSPDNASSALAQRPGAYANSPNAPNSTAWSSSTTTSTPRSRRSSNSTTPASRTEAQAAMARVGKLSLDVVAALAGLERTGRGERRW